MSDHHQDPDDEPLSFARRPRQRTRGPAPIALIVSLLVLLAVGGGVFLLYRNGTRDPGQAPQPVGAPLRDVKTAAPPQAPTADPAAGLSIYKDRNEALPAAPTFTPPPEEPAPRNPTVRAAPAPTIDSLIDGPPGTAASPGKVAATVAPHVSRSETTTPKPLKPTLLVKSPTAAATLAAKAPAGAATIQIGAFSSRALADKGWNDTAAVAPGSMAGKGKRVVEIDKDDGTKLYRTSITGFASHEAALALCERIKAAGKSCFVR